MKNFSIIVAFDSQYGIGKNGQLPWHLPLDLKHFKEITTAVSGPALKNAVIMGRNTWESLPERFRPLPGRSNLVLSRQGKMSLPRGVFCAQGLDEALKQLSLPSIENIFIIGGAQVFTDAIKHPLCEKLYVTHLDGDYNCDTFFPPISREFLLINASQRYTQQQASFHFCVYVRNH